MPQPGAGQLLLRTVYLSLDPYMRGRMSDALHAPPVEIGQVMVGGTVSRVAVSQHPDFNVGDWVLGYDGWQDYALSDGSGLRNLGPHLRALPACWACWACRGLPLTWDCSISANRRRVKRWWAASGAVGSVVGQIGKLKGCRVVGVAGGAEKCRYVVEELGFDACIDHRAPDFAEQLAAPARRASTSIMKTSAERCSTPCCRC